MAAKNSLERVLAVLEVFSEDRLEWTPEELMAELGYSRPTLYRYLKTLREAGFLTSAQNAGFTLGPKVVEMDFLMRMSDSFVREGQAHLEAITSTQPCTALLARWYGDKLLCVASECSAPDPVSSYPRGRPMPIARGAISRSIMANLPRRQLAPLVERNALSLKDIGLGSNVAEISDNLRKVRRSGFAVAHGEVTPGVVGIAAPVFDAGKSPIGSLAATLSDSSVTDTEIEVLGQNIRDRANAISSALSEKRTAQEDEMYSPSSQITA